MQGGQGNARRYSGGGRGKAPRGHGGGGGSQLHPRANSATANSAHRGPPPPYPLGARAFPTGAMHNGGSEPSAPSGADADRRFAAIIGGGGFQPHHRGAGHSTFDVPRAMPHLGEAVVPSANAAIRLAETNPQEPFALPGNPFAIFTPPYHHHHHQAHVSPPPMPLSNNTDHHILDPMNSHVSRRRFRCQRCGTEHDAAGPHPAMLCLYCGFDQFEPLTFQAIGAPAPPPPIAPHALPMPPRVVSHHRPHHTTSLGVGSHFNPYLPIARGLPDANANAAPREQYFCHQCQRAFARMPAPGPSCNVCHSQCVELIESEVHLRELSGNPPRTITAVPDVRRGGLARFRSHPTGGQTSLGVRPTPPWVPPTPRRPRLETMLDSIMGDHRIPMDVRVVFADMLRRQELNAPTPRSVMETLVTHTVITEAMREANPLLRNACGVCQDDIEGAANDDDDVVHDEGCTSNAGGKSTSPSWGSGRSQAIGGISTNVTPFLNVTPHPDASEMPPLRVSDGEGDDDRPRTDKACASSPNSSSPTTVSCAPVIVLPCNHCFHKDCIIPWLQRARTCPNCRHNVAEGIEAGSDAELEDDAEYGLEIELRAVPFAGSSSGVGLRRVRSPPPSFAPPPQFPGFGGRRQQQHAHQMRPFGGPLRSSGFASRREPRGFDLEENDDGLHFGDDDDWFFF